MGSFVTTRSRNSELWFVDNPELENAVLGCAAKYSSVHQAKLYALAIEDNHIQAPADFPLCNRSAFMGDFDSSVPRLTPEYPGGSHAQKAAPWNLPDSQERILHCLIC